MPIKWDHHSVRFINSVNHIPFHTCWEWSGRISDKGYGQFHVSGKEVSAHRYSFEFYNNKKISDGLVIDHICRNRSCVNPNHLREVTVKVNALENSISPSAINHKKTHCIKGHALTNENTYIFNRVRNGIKYTERQCRTCASFYKNQYKKKVKNLK